MGGGQRGENLAARAEVDLIRSSGDDQRTRPDSFSTMCAAFELGPSRPTTVKTRVISGGHHVVRVDEESTAEVTSGGVPGSPSALNALLHGDHKPTS